MAYLWIYFLFNSVKIDDTFTEGLITSHSTKSFPLLYMSFLLIEKFMHSKGFLTNLM